MAAQKRTVETKKTKTRVTEIVDRIKWMVENLSGCDWCCGGRDKEMYDLQRELEQLDPNAYHALLQEI